MPAWSNLPEDSNEYHVWERGILSSIERINEQPNDVAIEKLGRWVMKLSQERTPNWEKGDRPVFHAAQNALLAIPGHSEYYRDKINTTRKLMEENLKSGDPMYIKYRTDLDYAVTYGFQTMRQLPSVETVRVLGEFLFDERGYVREPTRTGEAARYDKIKHSPVLLKAGEALDHLPIVGKPPKDKRFYDTPEDLEGWRQWYLQIKEGKRTFRFEGDPTEYDLNGPASEQKLARIALDRKRDLERVTRYQRVTSEKESLAATASTIVTKPGNLAIILSTLLVLASAVWYYFRRKRA
jgi:hypothetical protein